MTSQEIDARIAKAMSLDELDRLALVAETGAQHAEICRRATEPCWYWSCVEQEKRCEAAS